MSFCISQNLVTCLTFTNLFLKSSPPPPPPPLPLPMLVYGFGSVYNRDIFPARVCVCVCVAFLSLCSNLYSLLGEEVCRAQVCCQIWFDLINVKSFFMRFWLPDMLPVRLVMCSYSRSPSSTDGNFGQESGWLKLIMRCDETKICGQGSTLHYHRHRKICDQSQGHID